MNKEIADSFQKNVKVTKTKDGMIEIKCKKGLWGVSSADAEVALQEAFSYFVLYYQDGEYDENKNMRISQTIQNNQ